MPVLKPSEHSYIQVEVTPRSILTCSLPIMACVSAMVPRQDILQQLVYLMEWLCSGELLSIYSLDTFLAAATFNDVTEFA